MMRLNMFIFALSQMFARQSVMFNIIDKFQMPDRDKCLPNEQANAPPSAKHHCQKKHDALQSPIDEKWIAQVIPRKVLARAFFFFCPKRRNKGLFQNPQEKTVKSFAIARGDGVPPRSHVTMVHQKMFGTKM